MKHNLMIDLDVLLDTRMGTIDMLNPEAAVEVLQNGFAQRKVDEISEFTDKLTNEEFKEAYKNRNVETLKHSYLTTYIFELANFVKQIAGASFNDDSRIKEGCVIINTYPYKDLDEQTIRDIIYAVSCHITDAVDIKSAYYSPDELSLPVLKESNILTFITYDLETWFKENFSVEKGKDRIIAYPKLNIYAPRLMPKPGAFDELNSECKELLKNKTPFDHMKQYWAPLFGLDYCPIELMTVIDTTIVKD